MKYCAQTSPINNVRNPYTRCLPPIILSQTPMYSGLPLILAYSSPRLALTFALHLFLNSLVSSLHSLAASTFAGLSSFGLLSMLITLKSIVSGVWTGDHRSLADS